MNTFKKEERLCSRKHLDLLFKEGSSFLIYPFRVTQLSLPPIPEAFAKVVINVPKKRYKRAVDRNLLKRRIREVYRLNKEQLLYPTLQETQMLTLISLQFVGKEIYPVSLLEKKMILVFKRLLDNLPKDAFDS